VKRILLITAIASLIAGQSAAREPTTDNLPVVYDDVTEGSTKLDSDAKRIYASKFRIVPVARKDGLVPAQLQSDSSGEVQGVHDNQDRTRERESPSNVICIYIITAQGRVIEPHILKTTDGRLSRAWLDSFPHRRYVPAKFRGVPVATLGSIESRWGPNVRSGDRTFRNGLGIQGSRDR
jgi:hypothetical protein